MKYPHVMIDLETLDTSARAAIASLAAVRFGATRLAPSPAFYARIDIESCLNCGLEINPLTLCWWLKQGPKAARELWLQPRLPLATALDRFAQWLGADADKLCIWGNGAAFDNAILSEAFRATRKPQPWKFYNDRCYRTVKSQGDAPALKRQGTHHHALDDARTQARHLIRIWKGVPF